MDLEEMLRRMMTGKLYLPNDESIMNEQALCLEKQYDFNTTRPLQKELRQTLLKDMLASIGENCYIEPPLHANWGGKHLHLGNNVYANFNLTLVDDVEIYIDDYVMIGPNVTIATGTHPILPDLRMQCYQYNMPVHIEKNVWLGAGCIVLPGVTIGENTVIGAGSVVTKDIPANVVAAGVPCRVLREINDHDKQYYYKDRRIDL
ncbi:sugar O-acetyltransferase [Beduini massiliensis]|uniref:sugar O-acetyltransferase n=1 Tax=Beduini massiliensis TaxID=1585974 RepID=UPI00059A917F|nr:sugar O-acetyltransferase [Beduini massiliensis]